jgi:hypothetical protein
MPLLPPVPAVDATPPQAAPVPIAIWLLLMLAAVAAVWAALFLWDRRRKRALPTTATSQSLFKQLSAVHRLSPDEVQLVEAAARKLSRTDPLPLFVDPTLWEQLAAADSDPSRRYAALGVRLFGREFHAPGSTAT